MCEVKVSDMSFAYGKEVVFNKLFMKVNEGDYFSIVGRNGKGKSTLLKLISGSIIPTSGKIVLNNMLPHLYRKKENIGYIPQNYKKNMDSFPITVEEIISISAEVAIKNKGISNKDLSSEINEILSVVDLRKHKNNRVSQLSGGQQQRVMLAIALIAKPKLLLLDEPTSGIDYNASKNLYNIIAHLNKAFKITVIVVSHDIDKATLWANKIAVLNNGITLFENNEEFRNLHFRNEIDY